MLEEYIKEVGGRDSSPARGRLREGAKVEARYRGRSKYYKGKIARDRGDGTFDIDYDDGEKETRVLEEYIKGMDSDDDDQRGRGRLREGAKVEARYRGRSKFYPGRIARDRGDGTFDIDYDDGEKETRVLEEYIKAQGSTQSPRQSPRRGERRGGVQDGFTVGEKIEAMYRGRSKWYPGRISRDRNDGTYDVDYDDGEKETRVSEEYIRSATGTKSGDHRGSPRSRLQEGAKVEARYRGRSKYYPGRIARDRGDGTYDIDYDDGEKETRVLEEYIKAGGGGGGDGEGLRVGDKVEARYRGRSKYYPGKIARVHSDGTFDVNYDDGESERGVQRHLIRSLDRPSSNTLSALD